MIDTRLAAPELVIRTWLRGRFHLIARRRGFLSESLCGEIGQPQGRESAPLGGRWCGQCGHLSGQSGGQLTAGQSVRAAEAMGKFFRAACNGYLRESRGAQAATA